MMCIFGSSHSEVLLEKGVMKICSKFIGEHPCRSVIPSEITLWHGCSPVNLLHIFRTPFTKNTSGGLLLYIVFIDIIWIHICLEVSYIIFHITEEGSMRQFKKLLNIFLQTFSYFFKNIFLIKITKYDILKGVNFCRYKIFWITRIWTKFAKFCNHEITLISFSQNYIHCTKHEVFH